MFDGAVTLPSNRVVGALNPFTVERIDRSVPAGLTIVEMLAAVEADPVLTAYGHVHLVDAAMTGEPVYVPRDLWSRVRPKPGVTLVVRAAPAGGGGGGGKKNPLRTILSLAVIAASFAVGGFVSGLALGPTLTIGATSVNLLGAAAGGLTSLVGNALVNAIAPPPGARFSNLAARAGGGGLAASSPTFTITGAANRANPYGPVPVVFGQHRLYPTRGAETYSEVVGNDQFFRILLAPGVGPLKISDIKIGETPLAAFTDVEVETREGWPGDAPLTLYTNDVHEEPLSILLTEAADWQTRNTVEGADEITLDYVFPRGLTEVTGTNSRKSRTVTFQLQLKLLPSGPWETPGDMTSFEGVAADGTVTISDDSTSAVRRGVRMVVATPGQYQVRTRRTTADSTSNAIIDLSYWGALRTIKAVDPVVVGGIAKIALRLKASEQFSGQVDRISCIVDSYYCSDRDISFPLNLRKLRPSPPGSGTKC